MTDELRQAQVKICGISDPHHALVALDAGADMIGLVFAKSPRRVSLPQAKEIVEVVRNVDREKSLKIVGLFVNETANTINQVVDAVGLDRVQLSGDEPAQIVFRIPHQTIGSVRIRTGDHAGAMRRLQDWVLVTPWAVIADAHVPGVYGGTGAVGDWEIAGTIASRFPTFLAGGLTPANVARGIETVRPFAVDVSSGVETAGKKDEQKIRDFIRAAKAVRYEPPENAFSRMIGQNQ